MALAVVVYQPTPKTKPFGELPLLHLVRLEANYYTDEDACEICRRGLPVENVWV
jgi:hypothetical protein